MKLTMVIIVVLVNIFISVLLLYGAWRVCLLKKQIAFIGDLLLEYERCSHNLLYRAPANIYLGQQNLQNLRHSNQGLQIQIQQVKQILSLLLLGQRTWERYVRKPVSISGKSRL